MKARKIYLLVPVLLLMVTARTGIAQEILPEEGLVEESHVSYPVEFFERYQPLTALDMVRQVPGFSLDGGDGGRGFGGSSGNYLINDNYPSTKQDSPETVLSRIPANIVDRIELIRGQVRGIDLQGQSVVVNIITLEDAPAAIRWEAFIRKRQHHGNVTPSLTISLSHTWNDIEYNAGLSGNKMHFGRLGLTRILDAEGILTENQYEQRENRNESINTNLAAATWLGETLVQLNTRFAFGNQGQYFHIRNEPLGNGSVPSQDTFENYTENPNLEVGLDAERSLTENLTGKAIMLYYYQDESNLSSQRSIEDPGVLTLHRVADRQTDTTEAIARLEFDWTGINNHLIQANAEAAFNRLEGALVQTVDTGSGPVNVNVPGANTRVEEIRWDFLLKDTWSFGPFVLDYGLGAETSTITQIGDTNQERDFFFVKPQGLFRYTSGQGHQTQIRLEREVSQLNLYDFISATVFLDDDLALGNPNLHPDTTWVAELSHERRFGHNAVIKFTAYHNWITDVLDQLPLSDTFEAPGNIGDGKRWGVELESTIPLDWLGLDGARVNVEARWQDSTVIDPVTGLDRILSSEGGDGFIFYGTENEYGLNIDFRQDFEAARVSWGWNLLERAERPVFKVNELDIYNDTAIVNLFVETTRWFDMKMRIDAENLTNVSIQRDRIVFSGRRDLSPVEFRELREATRGRQLVFTLSGTF